MRVTSIAVRILMVSVAAGYGTSSSSSATQHHTGGALPLAGMRHPW
jgi:hypothetical protein